MKWYHKIHLCCLTTKRPRESVQHSKHLHSQIRCQSRVRYVRARYAELGQGAQGPERQEYPDRGPRLVTRHP